MFYRTGTRTHDLPTRGEYTNNYTTDGGLLLCVIPTNAFIIYQTIHFLWIPSEGNIEYKYENIHIFLIS
jgi:hypothetical protein